MVDHDLAAPFQNFEIRSEFSYDPNVRLGTPPLRKISTLTFFAPTRALLQLRAMDQVFYRLTVNGTGRATISLGLVSPVLRSVENAKDEG